MELMEKYKKSENEALAEMAILIVENRKLKENLKEEKVFSQNLLKKNYTQKQLARVINESEKRDLLNKNREN